MSAPALAIKISGLLYALLGEDYTERALALWISGLAAVYILCAYKVAETKRTQILEILNQKKKEGLMEEYLRMKLLTQQYLGKPLDPA